MVDYENKVNMKNSWGKEVYILNFNKQLNNGIHKTDKIIFSLDEIKNEQNDVYLVFKVYQILVIEYKHDLNRNIWY
jgi:hypothetical protein